MGIFPEESEETLLPLNLFSKRSLFSEDSFDFQFVSGGKVNRLCISPLSEAIESATYKKKEDKFLIQLKKATELPWTTLKKN